MNLVINDFVGDATYGHFGEQAPLRKIFNWVTDVVSVDSGKEQRNQIMSRPLREWYLNWKWMDVAARNKLIELFQRAKGQYDTFLYKDYDDYACGLTECIVTAVGGETTTQLIKAYYVGESETWSEDKKDIVPSSVSAPIVKIDAAVKTEGTHFTLSDTTGIIDWTGGSSPVGALGAGEVVTASYQFYFRVRFASDSFLDIQHQKDWWETESLLLEEVLP